MAYKVFISSVQREFAKERREPRHIRLPPRRRPSPCRIRGDALKSNPGLVSLEAIQKWDGKVPRTLVVGDGVKPLLNVK